MSIFSTCNSLESSSILESVMDNSSNIETLEEGVLNYTASMIPILAKNTSEGTKYLVEYAMLKRLTTDMGIVEAFESICDENGISESDLYVVSENMYDRISEACDAIIGSDSFSDIVTYESSMNEDAINISALTEANVNILFEASGDIKAYYRSVFNQIKLELGEMFTPSNFPKFKSKVEALIAKASHYEDYKGILFELRVWRPKYDAGSREGGFKGIIEWFDEKIEWLSDKCNETMETTELYKKQQEKLEKKERAKEEKRLAKEAKKAAKSGQVIPEDN